MDQGWHPVFKVDIIALKHHLLCHNCLAPVKYFYFLCFTEVRQYLQPFQYDDENMAMVFPPDQLSDDEKLYFPEFSGIYTRYYLIIRNTAIVLWALNVKVQRYLLNFVLGTNFFSDSGL